MPDAIHQTGSGANSSNVTVSASPGSFAGMANRRRPVDVPAEGPPPPLSFTAAPENSEIATRMGSDGRIQEFRRFKNNPQLDRAEASWSGNSPKSLKIYLKDGRVVEVTSNRISNLKTATTKQLLELAGVGPAQPSAPDTTKKQQ